jgi:hypothetical protein
MAEGIGLAASAIAVIDLSARVATLCLEYSKGVTHAKGDIEKMKVETWNLKKATEAVQALIESPGGARLNTQREIRIALDNS